MVLQFAHPFSNYTGSRACFRCFSFQNATPISSLVPSLETANSDNKASAAVKSQDDIMSVLLAHEKRSSTAAAVKAVIPGQNDSGSESSADEDLKELDASEPGETVTKMYTHFSFLRPS
jgi:hypothetical protein